MSRHIKFSSVGRDLTAEINNGSTYKTNRKITSIAVHCTFSPQGRGDDAKTIDRWHKERWNSGIGYHYVVLEDGTIQKGRWVDYAGAHVKGYNSHSIGIVRIGGMGADGKAVHDATPEQYKAIERLVEVLLKEYQLGPKDVLGHTEYPNVNKSCPLMGMDKVRSALN